MTNLQLKEYDYLLNEINQKVALHNTLVTFTLTVSVTIIAFAYAYESAPNAMLLVPFCILIPMSMRVAYYRRTMAKISAYMIVFLESGEERIAESMHWETRLKRSTELGKEVERKLKAEFRQEKKNSAIEAVWDKEIKRIAKKHIDSNLAQKIEVSRKSFRVSCLRFLNWFRDLGFPRHIECLSVGTVCSALYIVRCMSDLNGQKIIDYLSVVIPAIMLVLILLVITIDMNSTKRQKQMWVKRWNFIKNEEFNLTPTV